MSKQLVLMDHDGGVDDYLATMLLMTMEHVQPSASSLLQLTAMSSQLLARRAKFWI
jgi:inosine-uridine nucleoside N-ribohydrolase